MATIGWDESVPSDSESAGLGDDRIRSLKSSLRLGLAEEHVWGSAGGDVGQHLRGSAKVYVGPQSAVSSAGTEGKLQFASDTSRLFGVGSAGTVLFGGPRVIEMADYPGAVPQRHQWVEEVGYGVTSSSGSTVVTFPNSGYSGAPYVFLTQRVTSSLSLAGILSWTSVSGTVCHVRAVAADASLAADVEFVWRSLGTRVL